MASEELERGVERLVDALLILTSDVKMAASLSKAADTPFARRTYVRAVFAQIEGNLNLMADLVIAAEGRKEISLSDQELELLQEGRYTSNSTGTGVIRTKFVPVRDRVAPVVGLFSRLYGNSFQLDKSTSGWERFLQAIELRNRITHPKNAASFDITDSEMDAVQVAREWFAHSVEQLLDKC